jgi:uncharacterized protein (DUF2141 family)
MYTKQLQHSIKNPWLLTTMALLTLCWATLAWAIDIPPALLDSLKHSGTARVIVQLNFAFTPEGNLGDADAVMAQRALIAQSQEELLQTLQQHVSTANAETLFATIPALVMVMDSQTLMQIQDSPLVASLQVDEVDDATGQMITDQLKEMERVYESSHNAVQPTEVSVSPASARQGDARQLMVDNLQSVGITTRWSSPAVGEELARMRRGVRTDTAVTLQGVKFNDRNGNGRQDVNEMGIANEIIFLRNNTIANSTQGAEGFDTVTTDASGNFSFSGSAGNYTMWTNIPVDWQQTVPVQGTGMVPYTVEVIAGQTVSILFGIRDARIVTLTVTKTGQGTGQVKSIDATINCGTTCESDYAINSLVSLTATAATGMTFTGWNGSCTGTATTTTVTMDMAKTCSANFDRVPAKYKLTVTKVGSGAGNITATGISCGTDCTESYNANTQVTLTATPDAGSQWVSWTGACSGTTVTTTVTMNQAKTCTARFQLLPKYTLKVSKTGAGTGSITATGINCGTDCQESYVANTQVTLTAVPDADSQLLEWTGDCSGKTATTTVTLDKAQQCVANFAHVAGNYTLSVVKAGNGQGTIRGQLPGEKVSLICNAACQTDGHDYPVGGEISLSAAADKSSVFKSWSCDGSYRQTGTPTLIKVTMDVAKTCTATFELSN